MASTGFTLAGTGANNADAGNDPWSSPGNITANDASLAVASPIDAGQTTQYLHATNFGFALPVGVTIKGIEVRIGRLRGAGGEVKDLLVQLIKGGTRQGNDKADAGINWPASDTNKDYGGAADLWGLALSKSDVEASNFGVAIRAQHSSGGSATAAVDAVWINVHYTTATVVNAATAALILTEQPASLNAGTIVFARTDSLIVTTYPLNIPLNILASTATLVISEKGANVPLPISELRAFVGKEDRVARVPKENRSVRCP